MTYKDTIRVACTNLAKIPRTVFLGYNVAHGGKGGGAYVDIPESQLIEMPLAENLMMGVAIGMALRGDLPVVYFERFDFITNAMDAIVNHLDKMKELSKGQFDPKVIIRVVVGNKFKPLYTGVTHTQDFTDAMRTMVSFPVISLSPPDHRTAQIIDGYTRAALGTESIMLVEYKDFYDLYEK